MDPQTHPQHHSTPTGQQSAPHGAAPAPQPARNKKKWWLIVIAVIVGLAVINLVVSQFKGSGNSGITYSRSGDSQLGPLKAGSFNYITACEVFAADDLDAITGKISNREAVEATFALKTDNAGDPQRTYLSECSRYDDLDVLGANLTRVEITNFSYPAVHAKNRALLTHGDFTTDASLQQKFGPQAEYSSVQRNLRFEVDNKRIVIAASYPSDPVKERDVSIKVGAKVLERLQAASKQASRVLDYAPAGQKIGPFTYRNACTLWGPADYKAVTGMDPDESEVETIFAETIQAAKVENKLASECNVKTKPAKTELDNGKLSLGAPNATVSVHTNQYDAIDDAEYYFDANLPDGYQSLPGFGDEALRRNDQGAAGPFQILRIRKQNVVFEIRISRSNMQVGLDADLAQLKQIAGTALSRL